MNEPRHVGLFRDGGNMLWLDAAAAADELCSSLDELGDGVHQGEFVLVSDPLARDAVP